MTTNAQRSRLTAVIDRLDHWCGAPENGHKEEGYIDLIVAVREELRKIASQPTELAASLSPRDHFAGRALEGIIASYAIPDTGLPEPVFAATRAYDYADEMLKARAVADAEVAS